MKYTLFQPVHRQPALFELRMFEQPDKIEARVRKELSKFLHN